MFMAKLTTEVLDTLKTIESGSTTTDQALQIAHIKALIVIARALGLSK
jgi:hypothetical protein